MSWAKHAEKSLRRGETVTINPKGNSMAPKVESGDTVTLAPLTKPPSKGDIVLVRVRGRTYLHLVQALRNGPQYLIGNNKGGTNGWVGPHAIYGKATLIER